MRAFAQVVVTSTVLTSILLLGGGCATTQGAHRGMVSDADVLAAQREWGDGIVDISRVHAQGGDYRTRALQHIDTLYGYDQTIVKFKPTLASQDQFRETREQALDYFVGRSGSEDSGFAIKGWTNVRWQNNAIFTDDNSAMAMGNYFFTGPEGNETKVEYSFGYAVDDEGDLRIILHHSSLPYTP